MRPDHQLWRISGQGGWRAATAADPNVARWTFLTCGRAATRTCAADQGLVRQTGLPVAAPAGRTVRAAPDALAIRR